MSTCNNQLKAEGATSWPRTCARCGIKKCNHPYYGLNEDGSSPPLKQIAGLLQKLSYKDMRSLSGSLHNVLKLGGAYSPELVADKLLIISEEILK